MAAWPVEGRIVMDALVAIEFTALWLFVAYLLARAIATPIFSGLQRELVPAAMAVALVVGSVLPHHVVLSGVRYARALSAARSEATTGAGSIDASAICDRASSGGPHPSKAIGSLDGITASNEPIALGSAVSSTASLHLLGWAALDVNTPANAACLLIDGRSGHAVVERYGSARPDVSKTLNAPALDRTGFSIDVPATTLAPGVHRLVIFAVSNDGERHDVPGNRDLTVRR